VYQGAGIITKATKSRLQAEWLETDLRELELQYFVTSQLTILVQIRSKLSQFEEAVK
ncbi:hypothetical protein NDU88_005826, partial [Pleurodeles waltl]